jgi:hypothetical protein
MRIAIFCGTRHLRRGLWRGDTLPCANHTSYQPAGGLAASNVPSGGVLEKPSRANGNLK